MHYLIQSIFLITCCATVAAFAAKTPATLMGEFADLLGANRYARIVWQSSIEDETSVIMAMDTRDGVIRQLVPAQPSGKMDRPTFTWDGERVIWVNSNSNQVYVADWNDGTFRVAKSGYAAGASCWRSSDGKDWVVAENAAQSAIYRFNVDATSEQVQLYTGGGLYPTLSPDGLFLAASYPGFGAAGIFELARAKSGTNPLIFSPGG